MFCLNKTSNEERLESFHFTFRYINATGTIADLLANTNVLSMIRISSTMNDTTLADTPAHLPASEFHTNDLRVVV